MNPVINVEHTLTLSLLLLVVIVIRYDQTSIIKETINFETIFSLGTTRGKIRVLRTSSGSLMCITCKPGDSHLGHHTGAVVRPHLIVRIDKVSCATIQTRPTLAFLRNCWCPFATTSLFNSGHHDGIRLNRVVNLLTSG